VHGLQDGEAIRSLLRTRKKGLGVKSTIDLYHCNLYSESMSRPLRIDYPLRLFSGQSRG